jgi:hypothetical protein
MVPVAFIVLFQGQSFAVKALDTLFYCINYFGEVVGIRAHKECKTRGGV